MDSLEKEELQLDCTQEELVELIAAKNKEIRMLRAELEKAKDKKKEEDELTEDKLAEYFLEKYGVK